MLELLLDAMLPEGGTPPTGGRGKFTDAEDAGDPDVSPKATRLGALSVRVEGCVAGMV